MSSYLNKTGYKRALMYPIGETGYKRYDMYPVLDCHNFNYHSLSANSSAGGVLPLAIFSVLIWH